MYELDTGHARLQPAAAAEGDQVDDGSVKGTADNRSGKDVELEHVVSNGNRDGRDLEVVLWLGVSGE